MKAKDAVGDGGRDNRQYHPDVGGYHTYQQRDTYQRWPGPEGGTREAEPRVQKPGFCKRPGPKGITHPTPDAALPPGADVASSVPVRRPLPKEAGGGPRITIRFLPGAAPAQPDAISPLTRPPHPDREIAAADAAPPEDDTQPREVEVRFLEAEHTGRPFPCLRGNIYTGCIGFDRCKVLCWSPRLRERQALVRVDKPTGGPCRDCAYAREVLGEVATLNGRQVRLIECRLGFWYGRTTISDFVESKIALNVQLPCPGFLETDLPHPAVARMREAARRRVRRKHHQQKANNIQITIGPAGAANDELAESGTAGHK
jgi:hypothetical protein